MWQQNRRIYVELGKTKKRTFLTIISIKINEIVRTRTEGLNEGKRVSDFFIYVLVQILSNVEFFNEKNR